MADLTITAASVARGAAATSSTESGTAGASITAGQLVYKDASDSNKFKLADSDSATAAVRSPYGIALHAAASGQPLTVLTGGLITIGATLTPGLAYYASKAAGGICPVADIASGGYATIVGIATTAAVLKVAFLESGVAV